jgi:hypothetical protein
MEEPQIHPQTCRRCRMPLGAEDRFCPGCGAPVGPAAERTCTECGARIGPAVRFCSQCGTPVGGSSEIALRAGWERLRGWARTVDWTRVTMIALPPLALLLAGLIGFGMGRQSGRPAARERITTVARGWRAGDPAATRGGARADQAPITRPSTPPAVAVQPGGPPTRFRDFRIAASSWEIAHPAVHAADGDPYTFWHAWETERFAAEGEWLTLTFPSERIITRVGLLPGRMGAGARAEGRVRSVLVKAGDEPPQKLLFQDRPELQYRELKPPVRTRKLILRAVTVLPGRETRHLLIPEVQVWGYPAPSQVSQRMEGP